MKTKDEAVICDLGFAISQDENLKLKDYNVGTMTQFFSYIKVKTYNDTLINTAGVLKYKLVRNLKN